MKLKSDWLTFYIYSLLKETLQLIFHNFYFPFFKHSLIKDWILYICWKFESFNCLNQLVIACYLFYGIPKLHPTDSSFNYFIYITWLFIQRLYWSPRYYYYYYYLLLLFVSFFSVFLEFVDFTRSLNAVANLAGSRLRFPRMRLESKKELVIFMVWTV